MRVIANPTNLGFAAAVNQGIQSLDDEAILILNPDTVVGAGIDKLEAAVAHQTVGAATGTLMR